MIGLMVVLLAFFMHGMILVLWGVVAILGSGYEIQGQNYVAMFQRSEMSSGFHYGNLMLVI